MFYNNSDPCQTGVKSITVGWVFRVEQAADERIHAIFGTDRVRMGQLVSITNPKCPTSKPSKLPVILYWDPRNTCDSDRWEWSQEKLQKWEKALEAMRENGVQRWYIDHVLDTIHKRKTLEVDNKEICFNPQNMSYTAPDSPEPLSPPRCRNAKPYTPQSSRHKAGHVAAGSHKTPNRPTSRSHAIHPHSAPRPQFATPHNGVMGSSFHPRPTTPTSTSLSPNVAAKKRKSDANDDGGQPVKKQMMKKPPPGPSKLRH